MKLVISSVILLLVGCAPIPVLVVPEHHTRTKVIVVEQKRTPPGHAYGHYKHERKCGDCDNTKVKVKVKVKKK